MGLANPQSALFNALSGSYVGDNSANRPIAHGLGKRPKMVIIVSTGAGVAGGIGIIWEYYAYILYNGIAGTSELATTVMDAVNFYVNGNTAPGMNTYSYVWVAIG